MKTRTTLSCFLLAVAGLPAATRNWSTGETSAREGLQRVAAGAAHSCAVISDGTVRCWGQNHLGQVGNGTTADTMAPVPVLLGGNALVRQVAVAAGQSFSCSLSAQGRVFCWGDNSSGQIKPSSSTVAFSQAQAVTVAGVARIAAGDRHLCVLMAAGTVKCQGQNSEGQLGLTVSAPDHQPLSDVPGVTGVVDLAAGASHTCALLSTGTVKCWGRNNHGQVGDGTTQNRTSPVAVQELGNVLAIAAGANVSCAISSFGETRCWGENALGQLGVGDTVDRFAPTQVLNLPDAAGIRVGGVHACAVTAGGLVRCWGGNAQGALGNPLGLPNVPRTVSSLATATGVALGQSHSCAVRANGTMACWGFGALGQLGRGGTDTSNASTPVSVLGVVGGTGAKAVVAGAVHTCVLRANGTVACFGSNGSNGEGLLGNGGGTGSVMTPTNVAGLANVTSITASELHTCALIGNGTVKCWGANLSGQVGNGQFSASVPTPTTVPGLTNIVAVTAGYNTTCAVEVTGAVKCWGAGTSGQLGNGGTATSATPVAVQTDRVTSVGLGFQHACATRSNGTLVCWGAGGAGQMGNGTTTAVNATPVTVALAGRPVAIAAGHRHNCVATDDGSMRCWGRNDAGQVGNGVAGADVLSPVTVTLNSAAIQVGAGLRNTCAFNHGGAVFCWGSNANGENGNLLFSGNQPSPPAVGALGELLGLAVGDAHACFTDAVGGAWCQGLNTFGQLGDGSTVSSPFAVAVQGL